MPAIVQRYAGAGKIEVWTAYTDVLPTEDINEYASAIKDNPTEPTYDADGDRITSVPTAITSVPTADASCRRYFTPGRVRLAVPVKGVNIVQTVYQDGHVSTSKVIIR